MATYEFIIDDRETHLIDILSQLQENHIWRKKRLDSGDIQIHRNSEPVLWIERKDLDDFWNSLKDGRYSWQKNHARQWRFQYPKCRILWLIEGDWNRLTPDICKRLRSAMWKLTLRDQCWVWYSQNLAQTANDLLYLSKQTFADSENWDIIWDLANSVPTPLPEHTGGSGASLDIQQAVVATSSQRKAKDVSDLWIKTLSMIPGMSQEIIQGITGKYATMRDWITACESGDIERLRLEISELPNGKRRAGPSISLKMLTFFGFPEPIKERVQTRKKLNDKSD